MGIDPDKFNQGAISWSETTKALIPSDEDIRSMALQSACDLLTNWVSTAGLQQSAIMHNALFVAKRFEEYIRNG